MKLFTFLPFVFSKIYNINIAENKELSFTGGPDTVNVGDIISWTWLNNKLHSVVQGSDCRPKQDGFRSPQQREGTFTLLIEPKHIGTVDYYCDVQSHCLEGMTGVFIVKDHNSSIPTTTTHLITSTSTNSITTTLTATFTNSGNKLNGSLLGYLVFYFI